MLSAGVLHVVTVPRLDGTRRLVSPHALLSWSVVVGLTARFLQRRPCVCVCVCADIGVAPLSCLVNLRSLKLKPPPYGVSSGGLNPQHAVSAVNIYPSVSQLKQLESLTVALPVLCHEMMQSIAMLTGLQVCQCFGSAAHAQHICKWRAHGCRWCGSGAETLLLLLPLCVCVAACRSLTSARAPWPLPRRTPCCSPMCMQTLGA